jgi:hypothetical protein
MKAIPLPPDEKRSARMITCSSQIKLSKNPKWSELACCGDKSVHQHGAVD